MATLFDIVLSLAGLTFTGWLAYKLGRAFLPIALAVFFLYGAYHLGVFAS